MSSNKHNILKLRSLAIIKSCFLLYSIFCTISLFAQEEPIQLPSVNLNRVQIIENKSYCSAGTGTQNITFTVDEKIAYSNRTEDYHLPSTDFYDSPYFRIGCNLKKIVIDYSYFESSFRFQEPTDYDGLEYNVVQFKNHNLFIGYSLSLVAHYFYLDLGVGYSHTQYKLDFIADGSLRGSDELDLHSSSPFGRLNLKLFITDYLYLHWLNQQALKQKNGVFYSNQLGISFLVRL